MINDLPALCIHLITEILLTDPVGRKTCDRVRDSIVLSATSRETRLSYGLPVARSLDPPNHYELLRVSGSKLALMSACKAHEMPVSGSKCELLERLRVLLDDPRHVMCGMGARFCTLSHNENLVRACAQAHARARRRRDENARRTCLLEGLRGRGCASRVDSEESLAFIRGDARMTLTMALDRADEWCFFDAHTEYNRILSTARLYDGGPTTTDDDDLRRAARVEAMRRWSTTHARHASFMLPRSLRHRK